MPYPDNNFMTVMTNNKDCPKKVPFTILNEQMALDVHDQTLKRLNERGGMSPAEIVANIEKVSPFKLKHDLYDEPFYVAKLKHYLQLHESD